MAFWSRSPSVETPRATVFLSDISWNIVHLPLLHPKPFPLKDRAEGGDEAELMGLLVLFLVILGLVSLVPL